MVTSDCDDNFINWNDCHITICNVECYCSEVLIVVCELVCRQIHVGCAFICSGSCRITTECEICFLIERVADFDIVAADAMLFTIISRGIMVAGNCYCHRAFCDFKITLNILNCIVCNFFCSGRCDFIMSHIFSFFS